MLRNALTKNHINGNNYISDVSSALCFLKHYGLDRHFKLNVSPGHQLIMANMYVDYILNIFACAPNAEKICLQVTSASVFLFNAEFVLYIKCVYLQITIQMHSNIEVHLHYKTSINHYLL